jgi:S-disulfanyl-L-cysteine oxidoreductase SoxD
MMHTYSTTMFRSLATVAAVAWFATAVHQTGQAAGQKSVGDGVYTAAQADRGETLFGGSCASCHAPGDFSGPAFLNNWAGKSLFNLYDTIKSTMPMDNPGSLKPEQYIDIVAFLLENNKFPAGSEELKAPESLKEIAFEKKGF